MKITADTFPADRWPNFSFREMACQHCQPTSSCELDEDMMDRLQDLRDRYGRGLRITSGYRCPSHPVEAKKPSGGGAHTTGCAIDIAVSGSSGFQVLKIALELGFTGVGIKQSGEHSGRFIHLDTIQPDDGYKWENLRPGLWSY